MKKRINERKVMKEVFECDYIYTCDTCGKENKAKYSREIIIPDHFRKDENAIFCSAECMRKWFLSDEADSHDRYSEMMEDDERDGYRGFGVLDLKLADWRRLLTPKKEDTDHA